MEMIRLSASDHKKKAYNIPALKNAAKGVIEEFFAEDGLVYADLELSATPMSSPPTSPSSTSWWSSWAKFRVYLLMQSYAHPLGDHLPAWDATGQSHIPFIVWLSCEKICNESNSLHSSDGRGAGAAEGRGAPPAHGESEEEGADALDRDASLPPGGRVRRVAWP